MNNQPSKPNPVAGEIMLARILLVIGIICAIIFYDWEMGVEVFIVVIVSIYYIYAGVLLPCILRGNPATKCGLCDCENRSLCPKDKENCRCVDCPENPDNCGLTKDCNIRHGK